MLLPVPAMTLLQEGQRPSAPPLPVLAHRSLLVVPSRVTRTSLSSRSDTVMRTPVLHLFLSTLLLPTFLGAQDLFVPANGPFGGTVSGVVLARDSALVAGTDNGIYRSTDRGLSWLRASDGLPITAILKIARTAEGTLFAGSADMGAYRSTDDGRTWTRVNATPTTTYVWGIAFRESDDLIVIAASDDGYVSSDDGETWSPLGFGLGPYAVAVDSSGAIQAAVNGLLLRSATPLAGNWDTLRIVSTDSLVVLLGVARDGAIVAGTDGDGFHRSTDRGETWARLDLDSALVRSRSMYVSPDGRLWIASDGGVIYLSEDHGATWNRVAEGLQVVYDLLSVPHDADTTLFAATSDGVVATSDDGLTWNGRSQGIAATFISTLARRPGDNRIFAGTHNGLLYSTPGDGLAWNRIPLERPYFSSISNVVFPPSGAIVVSAYGEGVYLSLDSGATWEERSNGLGSTVLNTMILTGSGTILVGTDSGRVYRATNDAISWEPYVIDSTLHILSFARDSTGRVWAGTSNNVYVSSDDGRTWTRSGQGITASYVASMATGPDGTLYAGAYNGNFFSSTDNGVEWKRGNLDPTAILVVSLVVDTNGVLFAGMINRAVYRSTDQGRTWAPHLSGIASYSAYALTIDRSGHLYVGTAGAGTFRSVDRSSSAPNMTTTSGSPVSARFVPLPATDRAILLATFPVRSVTTIELTTLDGRVVRRIDAGERGPGDEAIEVSLEGLPSGAWIARLVSAGGSAAIRLVIAR